MLNAASCFSDYRETDELPPRPNGGYRAHQGGRAGSSGATANVNGGSTGLGGTQSTGEAGMSTIPEGTGGDFADGGGPPTVAPVMIGCRPVETPNKLVGRIPTFDVQQVERAVSSLYSDFEAACARCHKSPNNSGGFHFDLATFNTVVTSSVLDAIKSDDPSKMMPPAYASGMPFSKRKPTDAVFQLATELRTWLDQNKPVDTYKTSILQGGDPRYGYDDAFAQSLTHLGSCVPEFALPNEGASNRELEDPEIAQQRKELDEMFASLKASTAEGATPAEAIGLPETLDKTDLVTWNAEELARYGVFAYAPAYPLWSDHAGKLRMIRVPAGKSIRYDKSTKEFDIPDNTRFYKTFLKKIIEKDGSVRYRKMETRLIVVRHDRVDPNGKDHFQALFGSYKWNREETQATLVQKLLRNGRPFADDIDIYITDEPTYQTKIVDRNVRDKIRSAMNMDGENGRVLRHYAIPSSDRCIECHMGSQSKSFILGFTPMQIRWRPKGEGGVIEHTGPDDLNQLDRLISYGLISGVASADELPKLEESQDTAPRNEHELIAQGYMFGNCAHCHNPRGFPSQQVAELSTALDFWPRKGGGGIFHFPLDRMSPRIKRGPEGTTELPYITPSLRDIWPSSVSEPWKPKYNNEIQPAEPIRAPWRSVIYRNVESPFIYSDDSGIFPHMPRNTAGFDCRAPGILGNWMVSIPAVRKTPELDEAAVHASWSGQFIGLVSKQAAEIDNSSQPYREPTEAEMKQAEAQAAARLKNYQADIRYAGIDDVDLDKYCPDGADIIPYDVAGNELIPEKRSDLTPTFPSYVSTDFSEDRGDWLPKNQNWQRVLVAKNLTDEEKSIDDATCRPMAGPDGRPKYDESQQHLVCQTNPESPIGIVLQEGPSVEQKYINLHVALDAQRKLATIVEGLRLADVEQFAKEQLPFGLWAEDPDCRYPNVPRTPAVADQTSPRWMQATRPPPGLPIFQQTPGEAIFNNICVNCHGQNADSDGIIAKTLMEMTGAKARVANFRTGVFGSDADGTRALQRVFSAASSGAETISARDMSSHYMAWMALGGTRVVIPDELLAQVANTRVLGLARAMGGTKVSANMLSLGEALCRTVLGLAPETANSGYPLDLFESGAINFTKLYETARPSLIVRNGDAELWERVCNLNNPSPVRAVRKEGGHYVLKFLPGYSAFFSRSAYPANTPIGSPSGVVPQLKDDNTFPWCVVATNDTERAAATAEHAAICPEGFAVPANELAFSQVLDLKLSTRHLLRDDFRAWRLRGAANAGLLVYLYLEDLITNKKTPRPRYTECKKLQ